MLDIGYDKKPGEYSGFELISVEIQVFLADLSSQEAMPKTRSLAFLPASNNSVVFSVDYKNDVGVIINPQVATLETQGFRSDHFVGHEMIADNSWIDTKLTVCDFVAFPGFPPWHDKAEQRPIFRTGTISSDPRSNYSYSGQTEGQKIAYEAFSFGGSSGSPVFALQKGLEPGAGIKFNGYRECKLIGVNAGHLNHENIQHSGISYFFKSSVILELIDN
ncbi:MAG: hypothetical protein Q8L15_20705 [Methylobacter sp.]|nr:hypothetical protein [Methylobacter sp.]